MFKITSQKTKELRKKTKIEPIATNEEFGKFAVLFIFFNDEVVACNDRKLVNSSLSNDYLFAPEFIRLHL